MSKAGIISGILIATTLGGTMAYGAIRNEIEWQRECDGFEVVANCTKDGTRFSKYLYHPEVEQTYKEVWVAEVPAKTHVVHHDAVYKQVPYTTCIKTTISYKGGTCARSRCRDGEYSGSSGRGTCSYHGGVWYSGGPLYHTEYKTELATPAWDETVVDVPAVPAHKEKVIDTYAREAYYEKIIAK